MKRFARWSGFRWSLLALLLAGLGLAVLALMRPSKVASITVLGKPVRMPVPLRNRLGPATRRWAWAWRLENALFGQRKPLSLRADIVSLNDASGFALSRLALGLPSFSNTNGLQVWMLDGNQLRALRAELRRAAIEDKLERNSGDDLILRSCRISTADGIETRMFQGTSTVHGGSTNQVGVAFGCFARVRADSTDLITCVTLSELVTNEMAVSAGASPRTLSSIQTNLDAAVRLQLPKGRGFFLLDRRAHDPAPGHFGMIVDPP